MWGIIGGTGFEHYEQFKQLSALDRDTPFGQTSSGFHQVSIDGIEAIFIARHGKQHELLPSEVNYRANIFALKRAGVKAVLSLSAVGSLQSEIKPGDMVIPHQYLDRTKGLRASSFCGDGIVGHVANAYPVCRHIANRIAKSLSNLPISIHEGQTYVAIEGPQFSTLADSLSYQRAGGDIIGMTNYPEYALAREAGLHYISCCFITNYSSWDPHVPHAQFESINAIMEKNTIHALPVVRDVIKTQDHLYSDCDCQIQGLQAGLVTPKSSISAKQMAWLEVLLN